MTKQHLLPVKQPGGIIATIIVGIVDALIGGFIGTQLSFGDVHGFDIRSMLLAIGGGVLVLFVYQMVTKGRV